MSFVAIGIIVYIPIIFVISIIAAIKVKGSSKILLLPVEAFHFYLLFLLNGLFRNPLILFKPVFATKSSSSLQHHKS